MNEVKIQELIEAIEKLSQKGWVDYLIVIVPIMLSVIAVFISISTARKQNSIALFDMRYKALTQLEMVITFDLWCMGKTDAGLIVETFDTLFDTDVNVACRQGDGLTAIKAISKKMMALRNDITVLGYIVNESRQKSFEEVLNLVEEILVIALDNKVDVSRMQRLHQLCDSFEKEVYPQLLKKIKI